MAIMGLDDYHYYYCWPIGAILTKKYYVPYNY